MDDRHARVTELFQRALELDEAARAELLHTIAAEDDALARELASLLVADRGGPWRTDVLAARGTGPLLIDLRAFAPPGFRIEGVLGEGAMGVVLAAEQLAPRRAVAIKVLRVRDPAMIARFTAEAEIMARLDHPGLARVLAVGEHAGVPFLVMERVEGATLDAFVTAERPSLGRRLALFAAVCDAIHHAHVKSVVHRDLKPSNIMVRPDGRVAVLDFGIARLIDGGATRTHAGELIGTPVYMSPEQARLRPDEVDTRSDVYTLGVILYELIAGRLPYDVRERGVGAIVQTICEVAPTPLARLDRAHGRDLEAVTARALAKEPAARYPSAAALADDVRRVLAGRPVSVRSPGWSERAGLWARRRPAAAAAVVAVVAGTLVGLAIITTLWLDARAARRTALASRDALEIRANELVLSRAQLALARDPTGALADLGALTPRGVDPWQVALVAEHARGLGVSERTLRDTRAEVRWVERVASTGAIVTASYDGGVRSWAARDGTSPRTLYQARGRAHVARLDPSGARVAIGADLGEAALVDLASGHATPLGGHVHDVERVAWTADGRAVVTADDHGGVRLWRSDGTDGVELRGAAAGVQALGTCPDSTCVFAGDDRGGLAIWTIAHAARAAEPGVRVAASGGAVLAAWADRTRAAVVTEDGTVTAWHLDEPAASPHEVRTAAPIHDAAFGPHGEVVVLGRTDGGVVLVDHDGVRELGRLDNLVRTVAISADGAWVAAGSDAGELEVWNLRTARHLALKGHDARLRHVAFDDRGLLASDGEGVVRVWRPASTPAVVWPGRGAAVDHLAIASDGTRVAVDISGRIAQLTDDGGERPLGDHGHRVTAITTLPGAIFTASGAELVRWGLDGARPVRATVPVGIEALAPAPTGTHVAVATTGGPIVLVDRTGTVVGELAGNDGGTDVVAFDPRGRWLASAGEDRVIRLWRVADGALVAALPGPTGDTHLLAFAPTGAALVAASDDGGVRAWDTTGGVPPPGSERMLARHTGAVATLVVTDRVVVSAGRDGRVQRIALATGTVEARSIDATPIALALGDDAIVLADASGALWRWAAAPAAWHAIPSDTTTVARAGDGWVLGLRDGEVLQVPASSSQRVGAGEPGAPAAGAR